MDGLGFIKVVAKPTRKQNQYFHDNASVNNIGPPPYCIKYQEKLYIVRTRSNSLAAGNEVVFDPTSHAVVIEVPPNQQPTEWKQFLLGETLSLVATSSNTFCLRAEQGSDFVASFRPKPQPLSSLVLRAQCDQCIESEPLLLSCLKRRLAGTFIVHQHPPGLSTVLCLNERNVPIYLQTESVMPNREGAVFFRIFPSTRITIIHDKTTPTLDSTLKQTTKASLQIEEALRLSYSIDEGKIDIPRMFLLSGPPGVGKTFSVVLALRATKDLSVDFIPVRGSEAIASLEQSGSFPLLQDIQRRKEKSILIYLDEVDALFQSHIATASLSTLLDDVAQKMKKVVVVAATNRVDSVPPHLRRPGRFDREISLQPPDVSERRRILHDHVKELACEVAVDLDLHEIAEDCVGYVPADLAALVRKAYIISINRGNSLSEVHIREAMNGVGASALRDAELMKPPKVSFDDIKGDPGGAKSALQQAVEWPRLRAKAYKALNLTPPRGILLFGPPGCAKTTLARAVAGSSSVSFLSLSPADVFASSFVGDSEAIIRNSFSLARSVAPCVLFFDEIDAIVGSGTSEGGRMERSSSAESRILSTFLNEMDGIDGSLSDGVLVLGATNRPWSLDAALLRFGRFDKVILVPPPDSAARESIINEYFEGRFVAEELSSLIAISSGMTGAEIIAGCRDVLLKEFRTTVDDSVEFDHYHELRDALSNIHSVLSDPRVMQDFDEFATTRRIT